MRALRLTVRENLGSLNYQIVRTDRRTLSIEIRSGKVIVRSPFHLNESVIEKFLSEKENWIIKKLDEFKENPLLGELYLGKVRKISFGSSESVLESEIVLRVIGSGELEKRSALEKFYREKTADFVNQYLDKYVSHFNYGPVRFRKYRSKWGSCSPRNELNFNTRLAMCPPEVIEYIVVHELCHTKVKNHSRKFYDEIHSYMNDYKKPLRWLRSNRGLI